MNSITKDFGGSFDRDVVKSGSGHRAGAAEAWRNAFIRMSHYKKTIVEMGIITDTFETAIFRRQERGHGKRASARRSSELSSSLKSVRSNRHSSRCPAVCPPCLR
jgi:hypothetical protein